MANNLRVFNTNSEYQSADLVHPAVSYVIETDKVIYEPTPPTPSIKWKATYSNGNVTSAECGSSSEIVRNEISLDNLVSVEIGDCVTSISGYAFNYCSSLTSCNIGSGVTSIGKWAFGYCSGLTSLTIPSGVTFIGANAFIDCSSLTSITVEAETPPTLVGWGTLNGSSCPILVPLQSLTAYQTAWSQYASRIQPIP